MTAPARRTGHRRRIGTATRLAAFLAVLLAVVLSITAYETVTAFGNQSVTSTSRTLVSEVDSYERATRGLGLAALPRATVAYLRGRVLPSGEAIVVGLPGGVRLGTSGAVGLLRSATLDRVVRRPPTVTTSYRATVDGVDTLYLAAPVLQGDRVVGTLVVAAQLTQLHADQRQVLLLAVGEAVVALVGAVAGAYLLLRRLLRTVGDITETAASIERGDVDRRLGDQGTDDEVGQLAATFDAMLDRIQSAMVVQRRLLSDVSHQLRTPLTVARGHLEVMARQGHTPPDELRETVDTVVDELDHMRALVERLLLLGRALEPDFLELEHLDLPTFLAELMESARVLADRRWVLDPVVDVVLEVDVAKLRGALLNLIDNAVGATVAGDTVAVRAVLAGPGLGLVLVVEDSGPGIPDEQLPTVLQRFGRPGSADREGSGLGVAIVVAVAEAHGGTFTLGRSPLGGCRAEVALPATRCAPNVPRDVVEV